MNDNGKFAAGKTLHFVGIGGIGMSGLAQMCRALGFRVSGSDRALDNPENRHIFAGLKKQGVALFPQDGSGIREMNPDFIIYSSAIEEDNPDFAAAADIDRLHRADALSMAMRMRQDKRLIAVAGSCGKTTVSAWLAETLIRTGCKPSFLTGGLMNSRIREGEVGNFGDGDGSCFVFEADESDKSLLVYQPDYAMILNIGTDHYPKAELLELFRAFLLRTRRGAVLERGVAAELGADCMSHLEIRIFDAPEQPRCENTAEAFSGYRSGADGFSAVFGNLGRIRMPLPGIHNAANALAVLRMLDLLELPGDPAAISLFGGVWRRFDHAGNLLSGAAVYDDYAHNVEKIVSCISGARGISDGRVIALFQPHGFAPLGFMREKLFAALEKTLEEGDVFGFLPVYYAGGSASFTPTSAEIAEEYRRNGGSRYRYWSDRAAATEFLVGNTKASDVVLIMGARDNSLSDWAREIGGNNNNSGNGGEKP